MNIFFTIVSKDEFEWWNSTGKKIKFKGIYPHTRNTPDDRRISKQGEIHEAGGISKNGNCNP